MFLRVRCEITAGYRMVGPPSGEKHHIEVLCPQKTLLILLILPIRIRPELGRPHEKA
jgi:hypothetical protein